MLIYPAVDLMGGQCVRLTRGAFDQATVYGAAPENTLRTFAQSGATWAHCVDLDGAKAGTPKQHDVLGTLAAEAALSVQVAGGVRNEEQVSGLLDRGVARVVIGSLAVTSSETVCTWLETYGTERIALAFDIRELDGIPCVAIKGWQEQSRISLWEALRPYPMDVLKHVIVTNIANDGVLSGPDLGLMQEVRMRRPDIDLQASGGIRSIEDVTTLKRAGVAGAIVGRALYEGVIDLREAVNAGA